MSRTLYLARHGHRLDFTNTEWFNLAHHRYDPPLSELGWQQASILAANLKQKKIEHIFASPFLRCIQTAYPLAQKLDLPIKLEPNLGEWLNAEWISAIPTLYSQTSLRGIYPLIDWQYNFLYKPSYPETLGQAHFRVYSTINNLLEKYNNDLLIVGHSITVSSTIKSFTKQEGEISTPFGCLWELVLEGGWTGRIYY